MLIVLGIGLLVLTYADLATRAAATYSVSS